MNTNDTRQPGGRKGRGGRRRPAYRDQQPPRTTRTEPPKKISFWQRFLALFSRSPKAKTQSRSAERQQPSADRRRTGPPERVEVTSPKLYVGNLNYETTEEDLQNLFNGVGQVQNAEIATHRDTERSRGFGFVTMLTVDEAIRAVETLHDKAFMGRKLVVSGSRSEPSRSPRE